MITLVCGLNSVELPNPILGDTYTNRSNVTVKHTMEGSLRTYVRKKSEGNINYTFQSLSSTVYDNLVTFLDASQGEAITITDWLSRSYTVYSNQLEINYAYNHRGEYVDVSLSFVGS